MYHWNTHAQSGPKPDAQGYDSLSDYCKLTSEIYEYYECKKTHGSADSKWGSKPNFFSANRFVDRYMIGNWIEVTTESEAEVEK